MTTTTTGYSTPAAYTGFATSLAAGNYDTGGQAYNSMTNKPLDVLFEYIATPAANPTGNKQIVLFLSISFDNASGSYQPGPTSATDTSHDSSLIRLGAINTNNGSSATEVARQAFSVAAVSPGGILPNYWKVIAKNDCGVALSNISARTEEINLGNA